MKEEKPLNRKRHCHPMEEKISEKLEKKKLSPRGRPPLHEESWTKATTILLDSQIHWLDTLAANIRLRTRISISRAEIIRSMISATMESGLDLSKVNSDEEIKNIILEKLKR